MGRAYKQDQSLRAGTPVLRVAYRRSLIFPLQPVVQQLHREYFLVGCAAVLEVCPWQSSCFLLGRIGLTTDDSDVVGHNIPVSDFDPKYKPAPRTHCRGYRRWKYNRDSYYPIGLCH